MPIRGVRHVVQLQTRAFRRTVTLVPVAGLTCGHEVHPRGGAALRAQNDVLHIELIGLKPLRAIRTDVAVSGQEHLLGERWYAIEVTDIEVLSLDHDDRACEREIGGLVLSPADSCPWISE